MATFKKGSFSINLGVVQVGGEFDDDDRQCAWQLYTEIVTRQALRGRLDDNGDESFEGELFNESLDSLYSFFSESRKIMRSYPVGRIGKDHSDHLGFLIVRILEYVVRPFLEKWQSEVHHYFATKPADTSPRKWQSKFKRIDELRQDWSQVRHFSREFASELSQTYGFFDVIKDVPASYRKEWERE